MRFLILGSIGQWGPGGRRRAGLGLLVRGRRHRRPTDSPLGTWAPALAASTEPSPGQQSVAASVIFVLMVGNPLLETLRNAGTACNHHAEGRGHYPFIRHPLLILRDPCAPGHKKLDASPRSLARIGPYGRCLEEHAMSEASIRCGEFRSRRRQEQPVDPLLIYRDRFPILARTNYLISNSLGAVPAAVGPSLQSYYEAWATRGVRAWEDTWWTLAADLGDLVAPLIGARHGRSRFPAERDPGPCGRFQRVRLLVAPAQDRHRCHAFPVDPVPDRPAAPELGRGRRRPFGGWHRGRYGAADRGDRRARPRS